ncbi:MAG: hypothetical protein A2293_10045 [Elusimicrobia bacterium RIFOXYB2_FULL_49_7]|nr:MAG: hypothetical protein A2293_10045 [Elusimicrobia bacterium RIFOXYB2_FULL_49_7]
MKEIVISEALIARCGLYCGACGAYLKGRCLGCAENHKATWCKLRSCCLERGYATCAECVDFSDPKACAKFNNFFSKLIGFVLNSDRAACIAQIKEKGKRGHAETMAVLKRQSLKRKKK